MSETSIHFQNPPFSVSVGTALKKLRESCRMSRAQLARASKVSASRLSSIERGELFADQETVARLAPSLGVEPAEIWSRARTAYEERIQMQGFLEDIGIPHENWGEFFELEPKARAALIATMQLPLLSQAERRVQLDAIEDAIERNGVEDSLSLILTAIADHGLGPAASMRASVELDEMPGDRSAFTDRLPISPVSVPMDWLYLFRASYGMDPPNPELLKLWVESRRSAMNVTLNEHVSHTIVQISHLLHYIRNGERSPNILVSPDVVASHLVATIGLLRRQPHFQLGLSEASLPVNYRIKGNHRVLVTAPRFKSESNPHLPKTTIRFSRPAVVKRFNEHFERAWADVPRQRKESESVVSWLEQRMSEVGQRGGTELA